jgi:hypothetical protein
VGTLDADYPLYVATGGTDSNPAIPEFNVGQSADTLYVTNGETTDYADRNAGTVSFTPELGEGIPGAGFVFPDDEDLIQEEFQKTLDFHLGLARSAASPANPQSPVGTGEATPSRRRRDRSSERADVALRLQVQPSCGDPQEVPRAAVP